MEQNEIISKCLLTLNNRPTQTEQLLNLVLKIDEHCAHNLVIQEMIDKKLIEQSKHSETHYSIRNEGVRWIKDYIVIQFEDFIKREVSQTGGYISAYDYLSVHYNINNPQAQLYIQEFKSSGKFKFIENDNNRVMLVDKIKLSDRDVVWKIVNHLKYEPLCLKLEDQEYWTDLNDERKLEITKKLSIGKLISPAPYNKLHLYRTDECLIAEKKDFDEDGNYIKVVKEEIKPPLNTTINVNADSIVSESKIKQATNKKKDDILKILDYAKEKGTLLTDKIILEHIELHIPTEEYAIDLLNEIWKLKYNGDDIIMRQWLDYKPSPIGSEENALISKYNVQAYLDEGMFDSIDILCGITEKPEIKTAPHNVTNNNYYDNSTNKIQDSNISESKIKQKLDKSIEININKEKSSKWYDMLIKYWWAIIIPIVVGIILLVIENNWFNN